MQGGKTPVKILFGKAAQDAEVNDGSVSHHHLRVLQVIDHIAVFDRMGTTGIGGNHAAKRSILSAGGVRRKKERRVCRIDLKLPQTITGFAGKPALVPVDLQEPVHVPGKIDHQALAQGRPAQAAARPPRVDAQAVGSSKPNRLGHIRHRSGIDNGNRKPLEDGPVRGNKEPSDPIAHQITAKTRCESIQRQLTVCVGKRF